MSKNEKDAQNKKYADIHMFHKKRVPIDPDQLDHSEGLDRHLEGIRHYVKKASEVIQRDDQEFAGAILLTFYKEKQGSITKLTLNFDFGTYIDVWDVPEKVAANSIMALREEVMKRYGRNKR